MMISDNSAEYVMRAGLEGRVTCAACAARASASVSDRVSGESRCAPDARGFYARNDWGSSINGVREMENTSAVADFTLGFVVYR